MAEDFASALLFRLTKNELTRCGILPAIDQAMGPAGAPESHLDVRPSRTSRLGTLQTLGEAKVALLEKRSVLASVAARAGYLPLLNVGQGLSRFEAEHRDDPLLAALTCATDPDDVFERWQRLEGYLHSRHRLVTEPSRSVGVPSSQRALIVRHVGPPGKGPTSAEDALILGVMAALCQRTGAGDLRIALLDAGGDVFDILASGEFAEPPPAWQQPGRLARWRFTWSRVPHARAAEVVRRPDGGAAVGDVPGAASTLAARLTSVIAEDPARRWTVGSAADALSRAGGPSLSRRTLQRRLAAEDATFPGLVRSVRVAVAGGLLSDGSLTTRLVGFLCGFADQPQFTRQFQRQTGFTPAAYRRAFGVSATRQR